MSKYDNRICDTAVHMQFRVRISVPHRRSYPDDLIPESWPRSGITYNGNIFIGLGKTILNVKFE